MNYHDAEQRGILKSIERPKRRGYLYAVFMAGLPASLCGGLGCPLSAFYQPLAGRQIKPSYAWRIKHQFIEI